MFQIALLNALKNSCWSEDSRLNFLTFQIVLSSFGKYTSNVWSFMNSHHFLQCDSSHLNMCSFRTPGSLRFLVWCVLISCSQACRILLHPSQNFCKPHSTALTAKANRFLSHFFQDRCFNTSSVLQLPQIIHTGKHTVQPKRV